MESRMSRSPGGGRAVARLHREESGQMSVLVLGMLVILLLMVSVVVGATTVHLESRRLLSAADGAASAASNGAEMAGRQSMSAAEVGARAREYLETSGAYGRFDGLQVRRVWTSDGGASAHVELSSAAEMPLVSTVVPDAVTVTVDSHSRVTTER